VLVLINIKKSYSGSSIKTNKDISSKKIASYENSLKKIIDHLKLILTNLHTQTIFMNKIEVLSDYLMHFIRGQLNILISK
jgi:hypothetical protein